MECLLYALLGHLMDPREGPSVTANSVIGRAVPQTIKHSRGESQEATHTGPYSK